MIPKPERDSKGRVKGEFYPLQKAELMALHKAKLINNAAFVHLALRYENPYCDRPIEIIPKEFAQDWGIPHSSVYEAIAKLKEQGVIEINSGKVVIQFCQQDLSDDSQQDSSIDSQQEQDSDNPECLQDSRNNSESSESIPESQNELRDSIMDSGTSENRSSEPLCGNTSGFLQINKTYKTFTNSLSESEREDFLKFGEQKAAQLPHPPSLPRRWVETNWQELSAQWYKSKGQVPPAQNSKWENDPRTGNWLAIIEETANPLEFAVGDPEKFDFVRWAKETKQFSWLREES